MYGEENNNVYNLQENLNWKCWQKGVHFVLVLMC